MGSGFLPRHPSISTTKRKSVQLTANLLNFFSVEENNKEQTPHTSSIQKWQRTPFQNVLWDCWFFHSPSSKNPSFFKLLQDNYRNLIWKSLREIFSAFGTLLTLIWSSTIIPCPVLICWVFSFSFNPTFVHSQLGESFSCPEWE